MAKFEEFEQFNSKEEEKKTNIKNQTEKKKKEITAEDKRKFIAYAVIGLFALGFVFYAVSDFSGDDNKAVQELETPISEADKYNTKLQAIEQGEKTTASTANLEDAYRTSSTDEEKAKNDEASKKLQDQLNNLEKSEKEEKENSQKKVISTSSGGGSQSYNNQNQRKNDTYVSKPMNAPVYEKEPNAPKENTSSGFFSHKTTSSKSSSSASSTVLYACIHTNQVIKEGSRVKMRLTKSVTINNDTFPINSIIYGIAKIQPNRLMVEINKINQTDVKLEIFDAEDSNSGIYVETPNLNAMLKKELKSDVLDEKDLEKVPFSKSVKNLLSKKAKEETIELLNNYKIIIKEKDEN